MDKRSFHFVSMPITMVMDRIEKFVIPENRKAIEYLWNMNILTTQTNNYDNKFSWIAIGDLDEENNRAFWAYANKHRTAGDDVPKVGIVYGGKGFSVPVIPGTRDIFEDFKPLFEILKMQDVQKDGYMTIEEFYIKCTDCKKRIMNPDYHPLPHPNIDDYEDPHAYSEAFDRYAESLNVLRTIEVFDPDKCVKDLSEYLADVGLADCYDEEEGKIFLNRRLYEGHMRYKKLYGEKKERSI